MIKENRVKTDLKFKHTVFIQLLITSCVKGPVLQLGLGRVVHKGLPIPSAVFTASLKDEHLLVLQ